MGKALVVVALLAAVVAASPRFPSLEQQVRWADRVVVVKVPEAPDGAVFNLTVTETLKGPKAQKVRVRAKSWHARNAILFLGKAVDGAHPIRWFTDLDHDYKLLPRERWPALIREHKAEIAFFAELGRLDAEPRKAIAFWINGLNSAHDGLVIRLLHRMTGNYGFEDDADAQALYVAQRERGRTDLLAAAVRFAREPGRFRARALDAIRSLDAKSGAELARLALADGDERERQAALLLAAQAGEPLARAVATAWLRRNEDRGTALRALVILARDHKLDLWPALPLVVALLGDEKHAAAARRVLVHRYGHEEYKPADWRGWWDRQADGAEAPGPAVFAEAERTTFEVFKNAKWDDRTWLWKKAAYGSGIGLRRDGWVLTTAHQIRKAKTLHLVCPDGSVRKADEWFWCNRIDIGVVHVPDYEVPVPRFGDSEALQVGMPVYALGNPHNFGRSLTRGVVSGLHRSLYVNGKITEAFQDYIQTDAQANPGNSGGALLDARGRVIGLVCESLSVTSDRTPAISFALPIHVARRMAERLMKEKTELRHGALLSELLNCTKLPLELRAKYKVRGKRGVMLHHLAKETVAAGLRPGDVVTAVDGKPVNGWMNLRVMLALHAPGTEVTLTVERMGEPREMRLVLARLPD